MRILEPGHIYELNFLDDLKESDPRAAEAYERSKILTFVNREEGHEHPGTQTQEVLRALIDRTYHCDNCMPDEANAMIIHHLRMALVYHEARALIRKAEKGHYKAEEIFTGPDGHFCLTHSDAEDPNEAPRREFLVKPEQRGRRQRDY